jgi:hypothetical protein
MLIWFRVQIFVAVTDKDNQHSEAHFVEFLEQMARHVKQYSRHAIQPARIHHPKPLEERRKVIHNTVVTVLTSTFMPSH